MVHVQRCGGCGARYSWPLPSAKVWTAEVEGRKRYLAECPHCRRVSALRWVRGDAQSPLGPLLAMLQRVTGVQEPASATQSITAESDAEIGDDEPRGPRRGPDPETPWSGPKPWIK